MIQIDIGDDCKLTHSRENGIFTYGKFLRVIQIRVEILSGLKQREF